VEDDMVKENVCRGINHIVECGHIFIPFGEVFNDNYDLLVSVTRWRVTHHEIDAPFTEGVSCDDYM
jgi:hypothetical protein